MARLLERRPELRSGEVDFGWLRSLAPDTLGGAYIRHLDTNGLTADSQAAPTRYIDDPERSYLVRRFRQTHDVWHALLELGVEGHEEVLLHAFSWGQLRLPVSALVVVFGSIKHMVLEGRWRALGHGLREAYEMGARAQSLMAVCWEEHWTDSLIEVRERFGVRPLTSVR